MRYSKDSLQRDQIRVLFPELDGRRKACDRYQKTPNKCTCCVFSKELGNWIGHLPGELEAAIELSDKKGVKEYMDHLVEIKKLPQGGHSSKCKFGPFRGRNNCHYKPLDCRLYPIFPKKINLDNLEIEWIRGVKCPMEENEVLKIIMEWYPKILKLCLERPELVEWFEKTAKGYKGYADVQTKDKYSSKNSTSRRRHKTAGE